MNLYRDLIFKGESMKGSLQHMRLLVSQITRDWIVFHYPDELCSCLRGLSCVAPLRQRSTCSLIFHHKPA